MALDFSQHAVEEPKGLDFSSEAIDFSEQAVQEEPKKDVGLAAKATSAILQGTKEVLPAIDLALGAPAFIAKVGATGVADLAAAIAGDEHPLATGSETISKAMEAPWMKAISAPLSYMAGEDLSKDTLVGKALGKVEEVVGKGAEAVATKYNNPELGAAVKQAADVAMLKGGEIVAKGLSKVVSKEKPTPPSEPPVKPATVPVKEVPHEEQVVQQRDDAADAVKAQEEVKASLPPEELNKVPATPSLSPEENAGVIKQTLNKIGSDVGSLADVAFGTLSTRLNNVHPELGRRAQDVDLSIKMDTHNSITSADTALSFLEKNAPTVMDTLVGKVAPEGLATKQATFDTVKNQWLNQDRAGLKTMAESSKDPKVVEAMTALFENLNVVGKELSSRGLAGERENYLPRIVKDREGLLNSLGFSAKNSLEKALAAKAKEQGVNVSQLDSVAYSDVVNKFLRKSVPAGAGKAGLTKGRVFEEITPEMQKFYYDPVETYHTYMERAWSEVHTADFFGRSKVIKDGKIDLDTSIGNYLNKLVADGKLEGPGSPKWDEAASVLETRFKFGHMVPKETVQNINNVSTIFTIANGLSALSNISDIASAPFYYGLKPAMQAIAQKVSGKQQFSVKDFGLADHISEEFIGKSATQRITDKAMTLSLWKVLDPMGKNIQFNSSLIRGQDWSTTPKGVEKLAARYEDAYGADFPQLVEDLKAKKDTFLTRSMVMWDVAQHQPLTKLQKSELMTKSPNAGGMMMKLKSFMMMQADYMRRNAYNEMKSGNYGIAFKNLMIIAGAWATVGVSQKAIKNFMLGKDDDIDSADIVTGMLGQVGFNEYAFNTLKQGRPLQGLGMMFGPPAVSAIGSGWTTDAGVARKTPVIGPWLAQAYKDDKKRQEDMKKVLK